MPKKPIVLIDNRYIGRSGLNLIKPVLMAFADKIGQSMTVSCPNGQEAEPYEDDEHALCLYFWSVPDKSNFTLHRLRKAYRHSVRHNGQSDYFLPKNSPSEHRQTMIIDPDGRAVAQIVGRTLYVLFDLPHPGGNCPDKLLKSILDDYYLYLTQREEFEDEMRRRQTSANRSKFLELIENALESNHLERLEDVESRINRLQVDLVLAVRAKRQILDRIKNHTGTKLLDDKYLTQLFNQLCRLATAGEIVIDDNQITIPIGQIDVEHEGRVFDIGKFEIMINPVTGRVRCQNLTRKVAGYHHPHVAPNGECQWGDYNYSLPFLVGDLELGIAVPMITRFLKSYNPDDALPETKIENWPQR